MEKLPFLQAIYLQWGFLHGFPCVVFPQLHALWQYTGFEGSNFIEIQGKSMHSVQELTLYTYIHVYVLITGISLFFEKQQHWILLKQGKSCKLNWEKMLIKQGNNVTKTGKRCYKSRENPVTEP